MRDEDKTKLQLIRELQTLRQHVKSDTIEQGSRVTEHEHSEEMLRIVRENLSNIFQAMDDGVYIVNQQHDIQYVNPALVNEFGNYDGIKCFEYFHKRTDACPWCKNSEVFAGESVRWEWHSTQNQKTYDLFDMPIKNPDGSISKLEFFRDITDRKHIEAERELLSTAIDQSAETIVITDANGNIQYVNPAFESISGYSRQEALGQNPRVLKSCKHDDAFYKNLWDTISTGKDWHGKIINRRKDGTLYTEEANISPVCDSDGKITNYVAVKRDITKEEKLKQQFFQAQKMESIGRLAGGIAHDFNNMLSVIMGYTEMTLTEMDPGNALYGNLQEINKAGRRSTELTSQLLAFSRKQTIAPKVLNINHTVTNMLKMLRRLIGEDIDLVWLPGNNLDNIHLDPTQLDQVLTNLFVNARDAIGGVGKITIETSNVTLDEEYCQTHFYAEPGSYILLTVSDDGCGMEKEISKKVFEPFYTTKKLGEGTGLGLATVYGIVKQNNGLINVYSEPGEGTSFKLYLPRFEGPASTTPTAEIKESPKGHGELILIAEDEPSIREMTEMVLNKLGYMVISASTPDSALMLAQEKSRKIELLLTDVVMPEMNGKELAKRLNEICPEMKVLFMSGYTTNAIAHRGVLEEGINFISKPFSMYDLAKKIREVLEQ